MHIWPPFCILLCEEAWRKDFFLRMTASAWHNNSWLMSMYDWTTLHHHSPSVSTTVSILGNIELWGVQKAHNDSPVCSYLVQWHFNSCKWSEEEALIVPGFFTELIVVVYTNNSCCWWLAIAGHSCPSAYIFTENMKGIVIRGSIEQVFDHWEISEALHSIIEILINFIYYVIKITKTTTIWKITTIKLLKTSYFFSLLPVC